MNVRAIQQKDDATIAQIIRQVLTEFGANRPGFAWQDPELDTMTKAYASVGRHYLVVETDKGVVGGGGIGEFDCELRGCCELQKMYLLPEYRRYGYGIELISSLLAEAKKQAYKFCYLETLSSMTAAVGLYRKFGFELLDKPLGSSGHNACDEWYFLDLQQN